MNTRIFTELERQRIKDLLSGKLTTNDDLMRVIKSRIRNLGNLSSDVDLYIRLRKAITTKITPIALDS